MKFGILGYFGYGNIGDEAILEYELRDLLCEFPEDDFVIFTNQDAKTRKDYKIKSAKIEKIENNKPDVLLWGGGWILYDGVPGKGLAGVMGDNQVMVQRNDNLPEWHSLDKDMTTEIVIMIVK